MAKIKKAPQWYLEGRILEQEILSEMEKILGIQPGTTLQVQEGHLSEETGKKEIKSALAKLSTHESRKAATLSDQASTVSDYLWARFRYENRDNNWGTAGHLKFNQEREVITMEKDVLSLIEKKFREGLDMLKNQLKND